MSRVSVGQAMCGYGRGSFPVREDHACVVVHEDSVSEEEEAGKEGIMVMDDGLVCAVVYLTGKK